MKPDKKLLAYEDLIVLYGFLCDRNIVMKQPKKIKVKIEYINPESGIAEDTNWVFYHSGSSKVLEFVGNEEPENENVVVPEKNEPEKKSEVEESEKIDTDGVELNVSIPETMKPKRKRVAKK